MSKTFLRILYSHPNSRRNCPTGESIDVSLERSINFKIKRKEKREETGKKDA